MSLGEPLLVARDLAKTYTMGGQTVHALRGVSLEIAEGDFVAIMGASGSGKSTLMNILGCLDQPSAGTYQLAGEAVDAMSADALASIRNRRIGFVFQQFNLSPRLDVLTNVLVGSVSRRPTFQTLFKYFPAEERARAILELHALDMADLALQRAGTLSGGQQQRVAIARTMMQLPDLVLADEPIASLDPANAENLMSALSSISRERGITVLVNLHSLEMARAYCPRIIGMARGEIVFDGKPDQLDAAMVEQIYGRRKVPEPEVFASPSTLQRSNLAGEVA